MSGRNFVLKYIQNNEYSKKHNKRHYLGGTT